MRASQWLLWVTPRVAGCRDVLGLIREGSPVGCQHHRMLLAETHSRVFQGELPASTLVGFKGLFHPDFLIEVEEVTTLG